MSSEPKFRHVRVPTATDHLALRTLMKYMSGVYGIPYKKISDGTQFNESHVKNYVNDKAIRGDKVREMFEYFAGRCADLLKDRGNLVRDPGFIVEIENHLFGDDWLDSTDISKSDRDLDRAMVRWLDISEDEIPHFESGYCGLWWVLRPEFVESRARRKKRAKLNLSLLHVRPRRLSNGAVPDFLWYVSSGISRLEPSTIVAGHVFPQFDRVDFLGRTSARFRSLTLMSWYPAFHRHFPNRSEPAFGIISSNDVYGRPASARIRAFFLQGNDESPEQTRESIRKDAMSKIGTTTAEEAKHLIPSDEWDRTVEYFEAGYDIR